MLGHELELTPVEMNDIIQEKSQEFQRLAILNKWKEKSGFKATTRELIKALLNCSRADLAQKVCELLTESEYNHRAMVGRHVVGSPSICSLQNLHHE